MFPHLTNLGHGIGLRLAHFGHILENGVSGVDWFEIISENFFEPGGRPQAVLERVRAAVPVVMHGVSMALGGVEPVPDAYLRSLRALADRIEPAWVSDHLCWGGFGGHHAHDLLPLPHTAEALDHVARQVDRVQERMARPILVENVSSYVEFVASEMREWEFIVELARRTGCGILLDVNNIHVSARNHGYPPETYLDAIPGELVGQVHLAGHTDLGTHLVDTHVGPVPDAVWSLYRRLVARIGPVPTLVEWDEDTPDYDTVVAEARRARELTSSEAGASEASATLLPAQRPGPEPTVRELAVLERRFWQLVSAPETVDKALPGVAERDPAAAPLTSWIRAASEEVALERLNVYANMYFFRLLDVLRDDYPKLVQLVGDDNFHNLATDYLAACPSENPSIRHVGGRLAEFLAGHDLESRFPGAADLARLEWARGVAFDAADAGELTAEALAAVPAERWGGLRLAVSPSFRIIRLGHPAQAVWQALERGEPPAVLEAAETTVLVWRRGFTVYHRVATSDEAELLARVQTGAAFGEICERLADTRGDGDAAVRAAFERLTTWIEQGLLSGVA
jgi:uncharacterized protein (UPF0276 family)